MSREWAEGLDASYSPDGKVFSLACVKQSLKGEEDKWYLPIMQLCRRIRQVVPGMLHVQKVVNQLMKQRVEVTDNTIPTGKGLGKPGRGKSYSKR